MPVLLAHAIEDSTDIVGIWGGGGGGVLNTHPLGTPLFTLDSVPYLPFSIMYSGNGTKKDIHVFPVTLFINSLLLLNCVEC